MIVRLGVPKASGALLRAAQQLGAPLLLSAGALYDKATNSLREPQTGLFESDDVALDSAGFVAWRHYHGYPWPLGEYVGIGIYYPWAWWSAPDACCEPEIASNRDEVHHRIRWTAGALRSCLRTVEQERQESADLSAKLAAANNLPDPGSVYTVRDPMPILQGWTSDDYLLSARWTETVLHEAGRHWPALVGVGSVCRRQIHGPTGLMAVVETLDQTLPPHVKLHLFGVKSGAVELLRGLGDRIASVDSQAWDMAARKEAHATGASCTTAHRVKHMTAWWRRQQVRLKAPVQVRLF